MMVTRKCGHREDVPVNEYNLTHHKHEPARLLRWHRAFLCRECAYERWVSMNPDRQAEKYAALLDSSR